MPVPHGHLYVEMRPTPGVPFEERIAEVTRAFSGRIGFHARHLTSGRELTCRADEPFPTASVIKLALVCAVLDKVAGGSLDLERSVVLPPRRWRVAGGGILKQLELPALSVRDLIELTIT